MSVSPHESFLKYQASEKGKAWYANWLKTEKGIAYLNRKKALKAKRASEGLCPRCGNPTMRDRKLCRVHLIESSKKTLAHYYKKKALKSLHVQEQSTACSV